MRVPEETEDVASTTAAAVPARDPTDNFSPATGSGVSRRQFLLRDAPGAALAAAALAAGTATRITAKERIPVSGRKPAPLRALSAMEAGHLAGLGEALVPGSAAAGLVSYVDFQLSGPAESSMLFAKYLHVPPPHTDFYRSALRAVGEWLGRGAGASTALAESLARSLSGPEPVGWKGPPAKLVYLILRGDATDVVYGSPAGFERVRVPYMAHIYPPSGWGE